MIAIIKAHGLLCLKHCVLSLQILDLIHMISYPSRLELIYLGVTIGPCSRGATMVRVVNNR